MSQSRQRPWPPYGDHDILKNSILLGRFEAIETSPVEIGDARHECEAERMTEGEYKIAAAAAFDPSPPFGTSTMKGLD